MIKQQELIRRVTGKNRLSNIMLCCKTVLDLIPQVLLIHMIGLYFAASLTREQILWECDAMLLCFIGKAVCAYSAIWAAHKAAYTCLTDLRLKIIRHLKKMSLGFFQERKTGDLTNIVQHDVEQVEGHLAHGLPETMSATILPAVVFLVMLLVDWRLALVASPLYTTESTMISAENSRFSTAKITAGIFFFITVNTTASSGSTVKKQPGKLVKALYTVPMSPILYMTIMKLLKPPLKPTFLFHHACHSPLYLAPISVSHMYSLSSQFITTNPATSTQNAIIADMFRFFVTPVPPFRSQPIRSSCTPRQTSPASNSSAIE